MITVTDVLCVKTNTKTPTTYCYMVKLPTNLEHDIKSVGT